jgi:hypothetical protein
MAKSMARKKRDHLLRSKGKDVTIHRATASDFSTHERRTMTRPEKMNKMNTKHKKRQLQDSYHEESAFFYTKKLTPSTCGNQSVLLRTASRSRVLHLRTSFSS